MTDKETLFSYRLKQAEETLSDAKAMYENNLSPRSITNRSYYAVFYSVMALFLHEGVNIKTSKHIGVISLFDKEFIKQGKLDKKYSVLLHRLFESRLESDYKDMIDITMGDADEYIKDAEEFIDAIKKYLSV